MNCRQFYYKKEYFFAPNVLSVISTKEITKEFDQLYKTQLN